MPKSSSTAAHLQQHEPLVYESSASSSPHDPLVTLASHVIRSMFGPSVQAVADVIQTRGDVTLFEIMQQYHRDDRKNCLSDDALLSPAELRASVAVLLQHGCVTAMEKKNKGNSKNSSAVILYRYNPIAAIRMLQYPRYVDFFFKDITKACCVQELLLAGRLRTTDLVVRIADNASPEPLGRKPILEALCQLVEDGFIEKAPEIIKDRDEEDDEDDDEDEFEFEKQKSPAKKLKLEHEPDPYKLEDSATVALVQNHPKFQSTLPMNTVWKVNVRAFLERQRANALGKIVAERHGQKVQYAGSLVAAALKYLSHERHAQHQDSGSIFCVSKVKAFLPPAVAEGLEKKKGGMDQNLEKSYQALSELHHPTLCRRAGDTLYEIQTSALLKYSRQRVIYQIIFNRLGDVAARVFSILLKQGFMESEKLAAAAMVPTKDIQEVLNRLHTSGYLRMMLFSTRQYNPLQMTYLWGFEYPKLLQTVTDQVATALLNIRLRRDSEAQVGKVFLERAKQAGDRQENEDEDDKLQYEKFTLGLERLDVATQQLEETLVCLLEF